MLGLSTTGPVLVHVQFEQLVYCTSLPRFFRPTVTGIGTAGTSNNVSGCWKWGTSAHSGFSTTDKVAVGFSLSLVLDAVTFSVPCTGPVPLGRLVLTVTSCV